MIDKNLSSQRSRNEEQEFTVPIEVVLNDPSTPYGMNIHTHGLTEAFGHLDLQIVHPRVGDMAYAILTDAVRLIKDGQKFVKDGIYDNLLADNVCVKFIGVEEAGRKVLRIIFPDENYDLDQASMAAEWSRQYMEEGPIPKPDLSLEEFCSQLPGNILKLLQSANLLERIEANWREDFIKYCGDNSPSSKFNKMLSDHLEGNETVGAEGVCNAIDHYSSYEESQFQEVRQKMIALEKKLGFFQLDENSDNEEENK